MQHEEEIKQEKKRRNAPMSGCWKERTSTTTTTALSSIAFLLERK
jgi:hypothetical protein